MSALGQKRTFAVQKPCPLYPRKADRESDFAKGHVRFTPESGHVHCNEGFRFVPKATLRSLLDHLIGASNHVRRYLEVEGLGGLKVDDEFEFGCLQNRQFSRLGTLENFTNIDATLTKSVRKVGYVG